MRPVNQGRITFIVVTLLLLVTIGLLSPVKVPLVLYKLSLVSIAAVLGYGIDLMLFPNFRPHNIAADMRDSIDTDRHATFSKLAGSAMIRRAVIIVGVILGVSLGI
ncbi:MAG: hypothetical protein CMN60_21280 [Sphingobium sp.]|nr:hypothetical protein [Sphingobium sp.]MBS50165.1 hypothetical protein [Sphingobium sp.]